MKSFLENPFPPVFSQKNCTMLFDIYATIPWKILVKTQFKKMKIHSIICNYKNKRERMTSSEDKDVSAPRFTAPDVVSFSSYTYLKRQAQT